MALNQLYQQVIMKHFKQPQGFAPLPADLPTVSKENPACGDHFTLSIRVEDGILQEIYIDGQGCAVSTASCSMMVEQLTGKPLPEALGRARALIESLSNGTPLPEEQWGDISALEAIRNFKGRITCAQLCWNILIQFIEQYG